MGKIIERDSGFNVLESIRDSKTGNIYHRVVWKGIEQTGYMKSFPGVEGGETISKSWWETIKRRNERKVPPPSTRRVVGVVKGFYDGKHPSDSFDFKIRINGRTTMDRHTAEERMRESLKNAYHFAASNIDALSKASFEIHWTDQAAIDIDLQRGSPESFTGQFEMLFQSGAWHGYNIPTGEIRFPNTSPLPRRIGSSRRTL